MKIFRFLFFLFLLLLLPVTALAAGSSIAFSTVMISRSQNTVVLHISCIGDDTNGTVPTLTIGPKDIVGLPHDYTTMDYHLWEIWSLAGAPAPDAADVEITDRLGFALFSEVGLITASGTKAGTIAKSAAITAPITITQINQGTVNAQWSLVIKFIRIPKQ
jgi:hypothetical protein